METRHVSHQTKNLRSVSVSPLSQQESLDRDTYTRLVNNRSFFPGTNQLSTPTPPTPPLVSLLPSNATVFHPSRSPQDCDSSFHKYIDQQFQQDATTLKTHLANGGNNNDIYTTSREQFADTEKQWLEDEPNTLWAVLKTDLDRLQGKNGNSNSGTLWTSYDQDQQRRPQCVWDDQDGVSSTIGAILFLFGFIIPPLWWLGAFWPRRPEQGGKMAIRWQQLNRYFSIGFSIILVAVIIVIAALYGTSH